MLKESLIKTLMNKHNCSKKSIVSKYGKNITTTYKVGKGIDKQIDFNLVKISRSPMKFLATEAQDVFVPLKYKIASRNLFESNCVNCNSSDNIEMHHIKHIKTINAKLSSFDKMVAAINRKQVPLCRECHIKIHTGKYKGVRLNKIS